MEGCINHPLRSRSVEVHGDYLLLLDGDAIAAAALGILEYWAQAEIAIEDAPEDAPIIWVGRRRIAEFEEKLCGFASEQQIRIRIKKLEERGLIQSEGDGSDGATKAYCFYRKEIQQRIDGLLNVQGKEGRTRSRTSTYSQSFGRGLFGIRCSIPFMHTSKH